MPVILPATTDNARCGGTEERPKVAGEKEQERALQTATAAFRRVISEPGVMEAFDAEFGGLPSVALDTSRAA